MSEFDIGNIKYYKPNAYKMEKIKIICRMPVLEPGDFKQYP